MLASLPTYVIIGADMTSLLRFILLLLCALVLSLGSTLTAKTKNLRLLFVGNSYTFYNDLPSNIQNLAQKKGFNCKVEHILAGGACLAGHYNDEKNKAIKKRLSAGEFDAIILQDQSQLPYYSPEESIAGIGQWAKLLPQGGKTRCILFLTWAHLNEGKHDDAMQDGLSKTYRAAAKKWGAELAPVGEAWRLWLKQSNAPALHVEDGSHPNARGSYLAALVLYAQIFQQKPTKLSRQLIVKRRKFNIPSKEAQKLQACALKALQNERQAK